jgi:AraC-like DNA-binding protein
MAPQRFSLAPGTRAFLDDLGISVGRVLTRADLPAGLFGHGTITMSVEEYYRFWAAVDAEAADPDLPARIGRTVSVEAFNPPVFAALCSANLRTAMERLAVFKPIVGPLSFDVTAGGDGLTIALRWPHGEAPPPLLVGAELAFIVALARIGTRREVRATRVVMRLPPPASPTSTSYFGTRVSRGETDAVTFSAADAIRPFLTEDESMWNFFAPELRRRLSELEASATTADRVRAVAGHLATSPRTLQRQLRTEGTSFQAVLTETRERLARRYLADRALTTSQIAYLLAYDDTNSFYRAFRQWTGTTPEAARIGETGPPS